MTGSKSRPAVKKAAAKKAPARKLTKAEIDRVDAAIKRAEGQPGYPMVKALGELAKLGPFPGLKKLRAR